MNQNVLITIIAVILLGFILFKSAVSFVCAPNEPNAVAHVISSVAPTLSNNPMTDKRDPLSWEPLLNSLTKWIVKVCPA